MAKSPLDQHASRVYVPVPGAVDIEGRPVKAWEEIRTSQPSMWQVGACALRDGSLVLGIVICLAWIFNAFAA